MGEIACSAAAYLVIAPPRSSFPIYLLELHRLGAAILSGEGAVIQLSPRPFVPVLSRAASRQIPFGRWWSLRRSRKGDGPLSSLVSS
jgi:hypothetical protein